MAEPESRVAVFLAVDVLSTAIALAFVGLRVGYRYAKRTLGVSDYLILAAMGTSLVHLILDIIITVHFGYARHQADLPEDLRGSWKTSLVFWLIQIFTKFPLMFSKLSLCVMYREILRTADSPIVRISRIINWITIVIVAGFFTAATFVGVFACNPVEKSWLGASKPGTCIDTTIMFNYITSSVNILTSILVIYIPLPVLLQTKHKRIEIKQLIGLVLLGLVDTIISCIRLYMIGDLTSVRKDFTWLVIPTHIVIVIELNMTIVAASLVVMRPAFQSIFNRLFPNSVHNSNNSSRGLDAQYGRSGYVLSSKGAGGRDRFTENEVPVSGKIGITKTVDIEMSSRSVSTEDILRSKDRF